jgi:hypothetical protein
VRAWIAIAVEATLWLAGDWWLIGNRSNWLGWVAAIVATLGLTYALAGVREFARGAGMQPLIASIMGLLATAGAAWAAPSWRWMAVGAWTVALIVAVDRAFRVLDQVGSRGSDVDRR